MTAPFRRKAVCPNCNYDIPLEDEISTWVRNHPMLRSSDGFTFMDKDLICHRFKTTHGREFQCMMFVEVKTNNAKLKEWQRDTMHIGDQLFRNDKTTPTKKARRHINNVPEKVWSPMSKSWVKVKAFGWHLLALSGRDPDLSESIVWDKSLVTLNDLIMLLRFDLHPDTLQPMDFRKHHRDPNAETPELRFA